jgi:hypothetical protein
MEYTFNATALGLGGFVERGNDTSIIPSLGSVVLAPTGGEGSAEVINYHRDDISVASLQTRVGGFKVGPHVFSTYSDILINRLNVFNRIQVASLQITMNSTRDMRDVAHPEARFQIRASYTGIVVDGEELVPHLDLEICSCETYEEFLEKATANPKLLDTSDEDALTAVGQRLGDRRDPVPFRGRIVHRVDTRLKNDKNKVDVDGLGELRVGELLLKPGRRRANLLRFDFGSDLEDPNAITGGAMVMASGEGNGTPIWPGK